MEREQSLFDSMTQHPAYDGQPARVFNLTNASGTQIWLMDIGATWLSFTTRIDGQTRELLLGVNTMAQYREQQAYLGAIVGRFANRIKAGQFVLNDTRYQVSTNQAGNCLHGGVEGFSHRRWQVLSQSEQQVTFSLCSEDGDQGFPGQLDIKVSYTLSDDDKVEIRYDAVTNKACPVNLTNHAYFNLAPTHDREQCLAHQLQISASDYLPTDAVGIPSEHFASVVGTGFDFRTSKRIGRDFMQDKDQELAKGYDHAFILDSDCAGLAKAGALATSPDGKLLMEMRTTKPAVQLYTGNYLAGTPSCTSSGEYEDYAGFALETEFLPDAPNHPQWPQPSSVLQPGETYKHTTTYRLIKN